MSINAKFSRINGMILLLSDPHQTLAYIAYIVHGQDMRVFLMELLDLSDTGVLLVVTRPQCHKWFVRDIAGIYSA